MVTKKTNSEPAAQPTFEQSLAALEAALAKLEEGNLPLGESLAVYEQGVTQLKRCYQLLETAQRKIELITGVDADGNPATRPFETDEEP